MNNELQHIGTKRHSGRYPWGSGKDPEQRGTSFLGNVRKLEKQGLSDEEIAKGLNISLNQLRRRRSIAKDEKWLDDSSLAVRLKDKGLSNVAIGKRMGINESQVRAFLDPTLQDRKKITRQIADVLRKRVEEVKLLDVGSGTEVHLGVSRTKLDTAVELLELEGKYKVRYVKAPQATTGKDTSIKTLAPADMPYAEVNKNRNNIKTLQSYSEDGGRTILGLEPPKNIDSKRIFVRYGEEGGKDKDGVIELRRGVEDLSLGTKRYAQVRVSVDGTHYMKGMAMYSDDVPKGFDIIYNTNKSKGAPKDKVFKPMKEELDESIDKDNPFGAIVKQKHYVDANGKRQLSALNIVGTERKANEEGTWGEWSKTLSSQVLSKQNPTLAKKQLKLAHDAKLEQFDEIMSVANPAVRKRLLQAFADECDSDAVKLEAAAMPRQSTHVLLPFKSIKEHEIFAPNYDNGEVVVLIRHPHGGIFEIPELIVNNKNPEAIRIIGKDAKDAVGINPKVANKLSGADFDGDTVLVIPNKNREIRTYPSLKSLMNFDPSEAYPGYEGMPKLKDKTKQKLMGDVSNLITDMTIKGANYDEIAQAVRHSMVVIDAVKHGLNYKKSAIDNNIPALKKKYQGGEKSGASTLISKAGSDIRVLSRKDQYSIDPKTGKKIYKYLTDQYIVNSKGKKVRVTVESEEQAKQIGPDRYLLTKKKKIDPITGKKYYVDIKPKMVARTTLSKKMAEVEDAFALSSGTPIETIYGNHANSLKALANKARLNYVNTKDITYSPSARLVYNKEVESLNAKLNLAFRNKPIERQAQLLANKTISAKRQANPFMEAEQLKKIKGQAIIEARHRTGADKIAVSITDREWEAIQAGAISKSRLYQMLLNMDLKDIKARMLPRTTRSLTPTDLTRARAMRKTGKTTAEIARALGVSTTTILKNLE